MNANESASATSTLAQTFHDDGFVSLSDHAHLTPPEALVARVRDAVLGKYEAHVRDAQAKQLDLTQLKNAEVLTGFYVRQGGRVDMQISATTFQKPLPRTVAVAAAGGGKGKTADDLVIDPAPFREMATCWQSLIKEIFQDDDTTATAAADTNGKTNSGDNKGDAKANYRLEYIGCVVSRPGDADQNWHLDGVHHNLLQHEKADRLNVFVPLVGLSEQVGGTEMKRKSHFRSNDSGSAASSFEHYACLESVTYLVKAGTPVAMDYRVWHRGRANALASNTLRPLLYFKYAKLRSESTASAVGSTAMKRNATESKSIDKTKKMKKRVMLTQVTH